MSTFICKGCNRTTNSACSQYNRGNAPDYCYAAFVDNKWVKGCGFDKGDAFAKAFAASLITGKDISTFLKKEK